jgi:hypothetical protein
VSRTPARFTQADVARCIRAAQQCGVDQVLIRPDCAIEIKIRRDEVLRRDAVVPHRDKLANWDDV